MTINIASLVSDNLDIWTTAVERKSGAGRGGGKRLNLYGVDRLRTLIIDLAVRGKLVPQDPTEEPASALLKKIGSERARLVKAGLIGKRRVSESSREDAPYTIPQGWAWTTLADIGHDWGQTEPSGDFTYVDVGSIDQKAGIIRSPSVLNASEAPSRARKIVRKGTVIYSTVRPYLLNIAIVDREFEPEPIASTAFAIVHPFDGVEAGFLYRYLRSATFISYVEACQTGIAYPAINDKQFFSAWFPLPPLTEQQRIVAKVDELMALCDALEAESAEAMAAHQALVEALLATLTASTDAADLAINWSRLEAHFDTLFTTEASIDALRQTILELAVRGKLVKQDASDEPGISLLAKISKNHSSKYNIEGLVNNPDLRKVPFHVPTTWCWTSLGALTKLPYGKNLPTSELLDSGFPVFGANGVIGKYSEYHYENSMLLVSCRGANSGKPNISPPQCFVTNNSIICEFYDAELCNYMCFFYFLSGMDKSEMISGSAQPQVTVANAAPFQIPLPPLAEQHRIVAKLDELMGICDALRASITTATATQRHLADAIVEQAAA